MSKDRNKRPVRIVDSKTGEVRFSHPMSVQASRGQNATPEGPVQVPALPPSSLDLEPTASEAPTRTESLEKQSEANTFPVAQGSPNLEAADTQEAPRKDLGSVAKWSSKGGTGGKPKLEIETLEQFIAHAFGRKGQRITLKSKVQRLIAQNPHLDDAAKSRLQALSSADVLLAVPRQLLLVSREVEGLPTLRGALTGFVSDIMFQHPAFSDPGVQACLRNLPDAPTVAAALRRVAEHEPQATPEVKDPLKPSEVHSLRQNAVNLLITWLTTNRALSLEESALLLLEVSWSPAARELVDDNARLRALTDIEQAAGVGVACEKFRQRAVDAQAAQDQALREAAGLRETVGSLRSQLEKAEAERDAMYTTLKALKESAAAELSAERRQHEVERTHLRHGQEQLRGRLVRRLGDSIEMLEVGLTALRNKTPRTEVMLERAEHVVDALRAEESNLKEA